MAPEAPLKVDVTRNRATPTWSRKILFLRVLWALARPIFAFTPRPLWGVRNSLLRLFGAKVGRNVHIFPSARISMPWNIEIGDCVAVGDRVNLYALGLIHIGARATVSQGAHLCSATHDINQPSRPLITLPVTIGEDSWVCADAFISPGVTVGGGAIIGARAVVVKDVPINAIVGGNPARLIRIRSL